MADDTFLAPGIVGALRLSLDISSCSAIAERLAAHLADGSVSFNISAFDGAISSPWMTTKEAASHLRIAVSELQRLAAAGGIAHVTLLIEAFKLPITDEEQARVFETGAFVEETEKLGKVSP